MAGMILAFYSLFVLPGILLNKIFAGGVSIGIRGISRVFLAGMVFITLVSATGFIPGVSLGVIRIIAVSIDLLLLLAFFVVRTGFKRKKQWSGLYGAEEARETADSWRLAAFPALFMLLFILFFDSGNISYQEDSPDHLSFVSRCVESGEILPGDSFYSEGDGVSPDPRKGLWHSAMALMAIQGDVSAEYLWKMMPSLLVFFAIITFSFFALQILGSPSLALLSVLMLLFFGRGDSLAWFTKISYGRHMVQLIVWGQAGLIIWWLGSNRPKAFLSFIFLIAFAGVAVHAVYILLIFTILAGFFIYTFLPGAPDWRGGLVKIVLATATGSAVPAAARYFLTGGDFNYIHTHEQGVLRLTESLHVVDPLEIVNSMGMAALAGIIILPIYLLAAGRGRKMRLVEVLYLIPVLAVVIPPIATLMERYIGYLHYRILFAAPLMCFLSFAVTDMVRIVITARSRTNPGRQVSRFSALARRVAAAVGIAVFILYPVRFQAGPAQQKTARVLAGKDQEPERYRKAFEAVDGMIPDHSTILSDPLTSYYISGLTGHYVYLVPAQHESPSDLKALKRNMRARDFFCTTNHGKEYSAWLDVEGIDYVLIDRMTVPVSDYYGISGCHCLNRTAAWLEESAAFTRIFEGGYFELFKINRKKSNGPANTSAPTGDSSLAEVVFRSEEDLKLQVERFSFLNGVVSAGDSIRGEVWLKTREKIRFDLPLMMTIRLDTDFPKGDFYRPWYGKQYRRFMERKNNEFYRFTHSEMLRSGCTYPESWEALESVRSEFVFFLPSSMKEGVYQVRIDFWKKRYLPVRTISDYFRNEDSRHGELVGTVYIVDR